MGFNRLYELREKAILDYNSDMAEAKRNGMEEARIKMIYDMVHTMGLSFEEIVKKMHISSEEQHQYKQYETNMLDKA